MVKQVNVLVTGSGSLYGLAIVRSLVNGPLNCRVVACDTDAMTLGLYLAHDGYMVPPAADSKKWLRKIIDICHREDIHGIIVGSSHEIKPFVENKEYINQQTGAKVFIHSSEVINICNDKWLTAKFLKENGFYYPNTLRWPEDKEMLPAFVEKVQFPLVAKPRIGAGSKGLALLSSLSQLIEFVKDKSKYIIQEFIPDGDGEFTVGVAIGTEGRVLSSIALKRNLQDGMTMSALVDDYSYICNYCQQVAKKISAYGPINLQLRLKNNHPYIFEINPRFSSSTGMRIALGVNEAELLIRHEILGQKVTPPQVNKAAVIRQYTDYVIPTELISKYTSS